jgi:molybdopterin synthase catalytic subunit
MVKHTLHHGTPLWDVPLPPGDACLLKLCDITTTVRARWPDTCRVAVALRCDAGAPGDVVLSVAVTSPLWAKSISAVTYVVETLKEAMPRLRNTIRV